MADLTYSQLKAAVTALSKTIAKDGDQIRSFAQNVQSEATDTARVADGIAAMKVDTETVGETQQLSKIMAGLSDAAIQYASYADNSSRTATAVHQQAHRTHDGMQEAFNRSPVDLSDINREWFRQE